jgi:hypothetical protein
VTDVEIPRDRWGRPLIVPPEGGKAQPYTRASTLAKVLDDTFQLSLWRQRKTLEGVMKRPDLLTRTAGVLSSGDPDTDRAVKTDLNEIGEQAMEAAGASKGSSAGTGFHQLTEALDRGEALPWVTDSDAARLGAYLDATKGAGLEAVDMETFVVCDELRTAGSFDRLWRLPDGRVVVGDLKTGKSEADYPLAATIQMAIYAHGLRYTFRRYSPDLSSQEWVRTQLDLELDETVGLLVHMPPSGGCKVIPLDLAKGWEAAKVAAHVKNTIRAWRPKDLILDQAVTLSGDAA